MKIKIELPFIMESHAWPHACKQTGNIFFTWGRILFLNFVRWVLVGFLFNTRFFYIVNQPEPDTGSLTKNNKKKLSYLREM